jgi:hypothetical protein
MQVVNAIKTRRGRLRQKCAFHKLNLIPATERNEVWKMNVFQFFSFQLHFSSFHYTQPSYIKKIIYICISDSTFYTADGCYFDEIVYEIGPEHYDLYPSMKHSLSKQSFLACEFLWNL